MSYAILALNEVMVKSAAFKRDGNCSGACGGASGSSRGPNAFPLGPSTSCLPSASRRLPKPAATAPRTRRKILCQLLLFQSHCRY